MTDEEIAALPVFLQTPEARLLHALVVNLRPRRVLEIGTCKGGSAAIISRALDQAGEGTLVCVDPYPDIQIDWLEIAHRATLLEGFSPQMLAAAAEHAGGSFDLALIDGEHTYHAVWADGLGVLPFMALGGYLVFHDAFHPPVRAAIDDLTGAVFGLVDCGLVSRYENWDKTSPGGSGPWGGFRLLRVRSNRGRRLPRSLVRLLRRLHLIPRPMD